MTTSRGPAVAAAAGGAPEPGAGTTAGQPGREPAEPWGALGISVPDGPLLALDNVSLAVPPGQVTVVAGGDGAGKTTLLRCLAGVLAPASGELRTPGARRIGYLPAGSGTYPDLTVRQNLAFRATAYGLPAGQSRDRAAELIERAGLNGAEDRPAGQLSGGMRQKLGVIAALMHRPELLILDEPTTGVDPVSRAGLWQLIAGAAAAGAAVVLATTYLDEAQRAAGVLVLDAGRELASGTPADIVATVPGALTALDGSPGPALYAASWRRAGRWRTWTPPGQQAPPGEPVTPDLQDAVTIAALAVELAAAPRSSPPAGPAEEAGPVPGPDTTRQAGAPDGPLAECVGVSRWFGRFHAVREVSLAVRPGEIIGLLGANGAGKTTLIRMLLGLLPASDGTVTLFGEPPSRGTRRRLGYVPQTLGLYDDLTPAENLAFSAAVFGGQDQHRRTAGLPSSLSQYAAVPVGRLPLGVQRRAAFAQALAHDPGLLILDEPTSGVDPLGRARLWDTIATAAQGGAGVLVTTHYLEEAQECDRLVIMADGAVVAAGTPAEVTGSATVTVVDTPAWEAAFARLQEHGAAVILSGRTLRLPAASPAAARQVLGPLAEDPGTRIDQEPASLEERFFQLVQASTADRPQP
ncbi:MAG TPA: ATP-binding cassette domain-containing protein [Streptosporangiaceae bacterium]|jgi:ABC-2 type transport system ATP-binding protein